MLFQPVTAIYCYDCSVLIAVSFTVSAILQAGHLPGRDSRRQVLQSGSSPLPEYRGISGARPAVVSFSCMSVLVYESLLLPVHPSDQIGLFHP